MASQPDVGRDVVESFLETGAITDRDIDRLIVARVSESVRLEYKGGDWLSKTGAGERGRPAKPGQRLAAWMSSFANTAGGVLLVGIDADPQDRSLPHRINGATCRAWASDEAGLLLKATDALRVIASRLVVPPRVAVVSHRDGLVLAVGVERAPDLLPCDEPGGAPVYYVRSFDGTVALADVVAADLLVGRRARPTIGLHAVFDRGSPSPTGFHLPIRFVIRNDGLIWIENIRVGILFRSQGCRDSRQGLDPAFVGIIEAPEPSCVAHSVASEASSRWGEIAPFGDIRAESRATLLCRPGHFAMAFYAVARGHPPMWWQATGTLVQSDQGIRLADTPEVKPCRGTRPRVACDEG